jgi:hypothetical protein
MTAAEGPKARGGFHSATFATLRPLTAGSARVPDAASRRFPFLAPQAAAWNPPLRLGSPVQGGAAAGG